MSAEDRRKLVEAPFPRIQHFGGCQWTGVNLRTKPIAAQRSPHCPWLWDETGGYWGMKERDV